MNYNVKIYPKIKSHLLFLATKSSRNEKPLENNQVWLGMYCAFNLWITAHVLAKGYSHRCFD